MSTSSAIAIASGICVGSALLEGVLAGRNVKARMAALRFPRYSPALWAWYLIGGVYYAIFFVILFRVLRIDDESFLRTASLILAIKMMAVNALWNLLFFRLRNMFLSFAVGIPYDAIAIALLVCLLKLDRTAAYVLLPYLAYLVYANYWGYGLWKLNR